MIDDWTDENTAGWGHIHRVTAGPGLENSEGMRGWALRQWHHNHARNLRAMRYTALHNRVAVHGRTGEAWPSRHHVLILVSPIAGAYRARLGCDWFVGAGSDLLVAAEHCREHAMAQGARPAAEAFALPMHARHDDPANSMATSELRCGPRHPSRVRTRVRRAPDHRGARSPSPANLGDSDAVSEA